MATAEAKVAQLLSIYSLAGRTGHSPVAVHHAIERFGILPDQITPGGVRYFSENIVPMLKEKMRKPRNGSPS